MPESGTSAPKRPPCVETAVSRFGRTFRISTTSVSPGSAPSIAIGPTSPGHFPPGFLVPLAPERLALDDVAGLDGQHRLAHGERRVTHRRRQAVGLGGRGRAAGKQGRQHRQGTACDSHADLLE